MISQLNPYLRWGYNKLLAPHSLSEDLRRREYILNIILATSIGFLLIADASILYDQLTEPLYQGVPFAWFSVLVLAFLGLYYLSRTGRFITAAYVLLALFYVGTTYAALRWGIDLPSVLLAYILLIIFASLLVSTRFGFMVTLLITGTIGVIGYLQVEDVILADSYWRADDPQLNDVVEYMIAFSVIMVVSWLSNREIDRSLLRARRSEATLRQERDLLEVKVDERTQELKNLQVQRVADLHRLAESGRLAAGFFHDLMNPLTALGLAVDNLNQIDSKKTEHLNNHLSQALVASRRMQDFIAAIQRHGRQEEQQLTFRLDEEIRQILLLLDYKARKAGVGLKFFDCEPIEITADPSHIYQIVSNLVSNAIDAYAGFKSTTPPLVQIQLTKNQQSFILIVKDFGKGIPSDQVAKIFEPFFTTKAQGHGMGLGLAITKSIVEQKFNGSLTVESWVGQGTTVTIQLQPPLTIT